MAESVRIPPHISHTQVRVLLLLLSDTMQSSSIPRMHIRFDPPTKTVAPHTTQDRKDERLAALLEKIGDYDVVCLQELFRTCTGRQKKFIRAAQSRGFRFSFRSPGLSIRRLAGGKFIDAGLVILRYFIAAFSFFLYITVGRVLRPFP